MQYSVDLVTLGPVSCGGAKIYTVVEIGLCLGGGGGGIQICPRALVVADGQDVLQFVIDSKTIFETQGVEKAV